MASRKTSKKGGCGCQYQQKGGKRKLKPTRKTKRRSNTAKKVKKMRGGCGCQGQKGGMLTGGGSGYLNPATYNPSVPRYDINTHDSDPLNPNAQVASRLTGGGGTIIFSDFIKPLNPVGGFTGNPPISPQSEDPTVKGPSPAPLA